MSSKPTPKIRQGKSYPRFSLGQRWEHFILILSGTVLLLTGLPQKYRDTTWSQDLLSTPHRLELIQQIHHIAAVILILEVLYHLGRAIYLILKRRLPGDLLPTGQDLRDAWHMLQYLFFVRKDKPQFGRYNFEQKITYWFIFFGVGIMVVTGLIIWFPEFFTRFLPGGIIPAALMAHSTEAIVAAIFVVIWHFYHAHIERLNLSMFTGHLSEEEMKKYHQKEYKRLTGRKASGKNAPGEKSDSS